MTTAANGPLLQTLASLDDVQATLSLRDHDEADLVLTQIGHLERLLQRATDITRMGRSAVCDWIASNCNDGRLRSDDDRWYYVAEPKKVECIDVDQTLMALVPDPQTLEQLFDEAEGEITIFARFVIAKVAEHLSKSKRGVIKHSACKSTLGTEYPKHFSTTTVPTLREGGKTGELQKADRSFSRNKGTQQ